MKRHFITTIMVMVMAFALIGCGDTNNSTNSSSSSSGETGVAETEDVTEAKVDNRTGESIKNDIDSASSVQSGDKDKLAGTYKVKVSGKDIKDTFYVFEDGKVSILENGKYSISDGTITFGYGQNSEMSYDITKTDDGYNLIKDTYLFPLVFVDGTDGLAGKDLFDGVYKIVDGQGYQFNSDGTISVITTNDCKIEGSEVTFAGATYDWEAKDGVIELSTNKTPVMTLVP